MRLRYMSNGEVRLQLMLERAVNFAEVQGWHIQLGRFNVVYFWLYLLFAVNLRGSITFFLDLVCFLLEFQMPHIFVIEMNPFFESWREKSIVLVLLLKPAQG